MHTCPLCAFFFFFFFFFLVCHCIHSSNTLELVRIRIYIRNGKSLLVWAEKLFKKCPQWAFILFYVVLIQSYLPYKNFMKPLTFAEGMV